MGIQGEYLTLKKNWTRLHSPGITKQQKQESYPGLCIWVVCVSPFPWCVFAVGEGCCWGRKEQKTREEVLFSWPSGDDSSCLSSHIDAWKASIMSTCRWWGVGVRAVLAACSGVERSWRGGGRQCGLRALEENPQLPGARLPWWWPAVSGVRTLVHSRTSWLLPPTFASTLPPKHPGTFRTIWGQD